MSITIPIVDPRLRDVRPNGPAGYSGRFHDLLFVVSTAPWEDGKEWLHASVSRRDGTIPTYDDLMTLKRLCIGEHRTAIQVFPPAKHHVDIAGKLPRPIQVLHLWACLSEDLYGKAFPEFGREGTI